MALYHSWSGFNLCDRNEGIRSVMDGDVHQTKNRVEYRRVNTAGEMITALPGSIIKACNPKSQANIQPNMRAALFSQMFSAVSIVFAQELLPYV